MSISVSRGLCAFLAVWTACGGGAPAPAARPAAQHKVVDRALGLVLTSVPAGFTATPAADGLRLRRADGSEITIGWGIGAQEGSDLVAAVTAEKARFLALPGGRSCGSIEILSGLGRGYLTRGRYRAGGREVEEIRVVAVHPREHARSVVLSYVYPAAESRAERADQALAVFGNVTLL